jgi:hypothetical protein
MIDRQRWHSLEFLQAGAFLRGRYYALFIMRVQNNEKSNRAIARDCREFVFGQ